MSKPRVLLVTLLFLAPLMAGAGTGAQRVAHFPSELLGVWDAYPLPCAAGAPSDSDTRIQIGNDVLHGYENNDALQSIEAIAESPMVWRVVTISDIAPADIQGEADIYVLRGNALTITNGERTHTFIRCR